MTMGLRYIGFTLVVIWTLFAGAAVVLDDLDQPMPGLGMLGFWALLVGSLTLIVAAGIDKLHERHDR